MGSNSLGRIGATVSTTLSTTTRAVSPVLQQSSTEKPVSLVKTVIRPVILGSVDGIITTFVVLAGGIASNVAKKSVVAIGFSSLAADGFSMGVSEYLSSKPTQGFYTSMMMGLSCFMSFVLFGSIPLIGYTLSSNKSSEITVSLVLFFACLVTVSIVRSKYDDVGRIQSLLETCVVGGAAAGIAYGIASML